MRILHIMAGARSGGAETMMLNAVSALADAGVAQFVLTRDNAPARMAALQSMNVGFEAAPFDPLWRRPTQTRLRAATQAFKPDVLHHWMGRAGSFAQPQTRARNLGWEPGRYRLDRFKNCTWHATTSADAANQLLALGVSHDRTVLMPHFIDHTGKTAPTPRASLSTPEGAPVVLSITRLNALRGLDTLLDAVAGLPGVYLWIAGDGAMAAPLRAHAQAVGAEDRVRFLSAPADRAALVAACDVVALPARPEPLGALALEAWRGGKPLVAVRATDSGGLAAGPQLRADRDAIVVAPVDTAGLREGLRRALEDAALVSALTAQGRRSFEAHHTRQAFVRHALAAYERIHAEAAARA